MGKINKYSLIYSKTNHLIENIVFIILSVLVCLISDNYSFNPFLLVLIYISYIRGINNYLFTVSATILTSLLINVSYGFEIILINVCFFLFCLIFCFIKKQGFIKKYGPFIFTHILFFILYISRYFSIESIINLLISTTISFILLYGYLSFERGIVEKNKFDNVAKVIVLSTCSILFFGINGMYLFFSRVIHLIIGKTVSPIEGALSIIINCFIIYYLQDSNSFILLSLIVPGLISVFFSNKYVVPIYLFLYVFIYLYFGEKFYLMPSFYQGLLAILVIMIIPNDFYFLIKKIMSKDNNQQLQETNERLKEVSEIVSNIISYLDVVLSNTIDTNYSPIDKTLLVIKDKVCSECQRKGVCSLYFVMKQSLEYEFTKENKTKLFQECLYPYKIIRQIRINKQTLINEQKYHEEIKNKNEIYKQEIENIYKPLRKIFSETNLFSRKKTQLIEELEAYEFFINDVSLSENNIHFSISLEDKEDILKVLTIISNCMKKTYYLEEMFYILSEGQYQVSISSSPLFKLDVATINYGVNASFNGDNYLSFYENNHYYLMLSDGIGHNKSSSNVSFFMINALNSYRKIEKNVEKQIVNINSLLKSKIDEEMYATLDYVDIDLVKGELEIFKCGSFNSYLFHNDQLVKFKSNTPPLGIIYNIKTSSLTKALQKEDILIFMTDGYLQEPEKTLLNVLRKNKDKPSKEIVELLDQELLKIKEVEDDKTIIVIKVSEAKKFNKEKKEPKIIPLSNEIN